MHWSELGHQERVGTKGEREREKGDEKGREPFTVTASCCCLPAGRIVDFRQFFLPLKYVHVCVAAVGYM